MQGSSKKQVLGIVGSPRRGGNTEIMVDEVLRGAQEAGAAAAKVILNELDIAPCDACGACEDTGECTTMDDMEELLDKMRQSDVWVLGTPVYWWGPSAQLKLFIDRWYSKAHRAQDKAMFKGKRVVAVIPMGDGDPATARHTVGMLTDALDYMKASLFATVLGTGVNDVGEVREHPGVLEKAYRAGLNAAREAP
jgi:multimeric flavodoxin WrbA